MARPFERVCRTSDVEEHGYRDTIIPFGAGWSHTGERADVCQARLDRQMAGMIGGINCDPIALGALRERFQQTWGEIETAGSGTWAVAAHTYVPARCVLESGDGEICAIDGTASLQRAFASRTPRAFLPRDAAGALDLLSIVPTYPGNIAVFSPDRHDLILATDWSGSFPLYFAQVGAGLLFSSSLTCLARAIHAQPDLAGVLQLLQRGHCLADRTLYQGVRRVEAGQVVHFSRGAMKVMETSRAWTVLNHEWQTPDAAAEACWPGVRAGMQALQSGGSAALMMSAGWDSRTLLGACEHSHNLLAYTHGDLQSRELAIVQRLCARAGVELHREPIDGRVYDYERLQSSFARVENAIFPHWHRAGAVLHDLGCDVVAAGVFGEVLGGHYGRAMLAGGGRKISAVAGSLWGRSSPQEDATPDATHLLEHLLVRSFTTPWYLREISDHAGVVQTTNDDVERAVRRLVVRGVASSDQLVEAYISENRGGKYINAQILSCRNQLAVELPFAERELMYLASTIPLSVKIHNRINRSMLRQHAPALLQEPLAATLASAAAPFVVQEGSRLIRSIYEDRRWWLHFRTSGRVSPPHLGWVNFEFLRDGRVLRELIANLKSELWDRDRMLARVAAIEQREWRQQLHPMFDQMSKILTVDLALS